MFVLVEDGSMEKDGCLSENVGMVENGYIVVVGRMVEFKGRKEGGSCVEWYIKRGRCVEREEGV